MITENDVRLIRQFLFAREENRFDDAEKIWKYLTETQGLALEIQEPTEMMKKRWNVPDSVPEVVILVSYGREPIWRIPATLKKRELGVFEVPAKVPKELKGIARV